MATSIPLAKISCTEGQQQLRQIEFLVMPLSLLLDEPIELLSHTHTTTDPTIGKKEMTSMVAKRMFVFLGDNRWAPPARA
jgi:hypothetical protein